MISNKKVALLTNMITPYRVPFFNELSKRVKILDILTCVDREIDREWKIEGAQNYKITPLSGITLNLSKGSDAKRILHFRFGILWHLIKSRPDILIIGDASWTSFIAGFLCKFLFIKYIVWNEITTKSQVSTGLVRVLRKYLYLGAKSCIASCQMAKKYLEDNGVSGTKISIINNSVDNDYFLNKKEQLKEKRKILRLSLGIKSNEYTFIYVGQLISRKRVMQTIDIVANLSKAHNVHLLIAGTGPLKDKMVNRAKEIEFSNITFCDYAAPDKLCELYTASDALILLSDDEPWGMVVNEALLFELNIFASEAVSAAVELKEKFKNIKIVNVEQSLDVDMLKPINEGNLKEIPSKESMAKGFYNAII